jgi:autotransporter-associated beta strand protein
MVQLAHANTELWRGVSGTSVSTNWSDVANWNNLTGTGNPGYTNNDLLFGNGGAEATDNTINSVVDTTSSSLSMTFTNQSQNSFFHTVFIPAGQTHTNAGGLVVGTATAIDGNLTKVNFVGGGTLLQNGTPLTVRNNSVNQGASFALATLDLSGLTNFVFNNSGGTINVSGTGSETRAGGQLILAGGSNNVTAGTINFWTSGGNQGNSTATALKLGAGTNIFNVGNFNIVAGKVNSGTISFQGGTGGLRVRGVNGNSDDTSRATITIANRNNTGTGTVNGTADFTGGHPIDIKAGTIIIGQSGSNPSSAQGCNGTLQFDIGTIDATTINMAVNSVANVTTTGTLTMGGGALFVGGGGITVVNQTAGTGISTGTLTISSGTVQVLGNIKKGNASGLANISISAASLNMAAFTNTIGTTAVPIDNLTLGNSTLTLPVTVGSPGAAVINLTINGSSDTINISSVPGTATFPAQFPVITYINPIAGTYDFTLGTLPGTYQGYLSNNAANSSVDLVLTNSLVKTDTWRGNVNGNWDLSTLNWFYSGAPASYAQGDFVTFDDTLTGTPNVTLTANMLPGAVTFNNSSHSYVLSGAFKLTGTMALTKHGSGTTTLAESGGDDFTGGILVDGGTLLLDNTNSLISGGLAISGGTVQVGNNDANGALPSGGITDDGALVFNRVDNLTVSTPISGSGSLTQNGSGVLTLTGVNSYTGNTTIGAGKLALSGGGSINSSALVSVNGATLDVSAVTQPASLSGLTLNNGALTVSVNSSGLPSVNSASFTFSGAANFLNVSALPPIASYPVTFTVIQSSVAAGGTFNMSLGTLPAATPPYAANVTQSADQMAVLLTVTGGPVGVRSAVLWTGADVANSNTNWSDRLNWQLPGAPSFGETAFFNNTAAQTFSAVGAPGGGSAALVPDFLNNFVDADFTISALVYTNLSSSGAATYQNTWINSGKTLSLTNAGLTIGALDSGSSAQQDLVSISGANATLNLTATNGNLQVWVGSSSGGGSQSTLDLSALDRFSASISRLLVGATIGNVVNRPSGVVYLAKTNTISAAFQTTTSEAGTTTANSGIVIADCNQNAGSASFLYLGLVNAISADTISIGRQKAPGHLLFNPLYANIAPYPSVIFQGFSSSTVSIFDVGDGAGNTGTTTFSADANLSGGLVGASIDTMNIGRASSGSGTGNTTGSLEFDAGTITVNTLNVGLQPTSGTKVGIGNVGVGSNTVMAAGATLIVRGQLSLAGAAGGAGAVSTSGTLGITNGTVRALSIVPGTGSASTNILAGGRLFVTNAVGTSAAPLGDLLLAPLGTSDNIRNDLYLPIGTNASGIIVGNLDLDALDTTTNVINIESVGPVANLPLELPLIRYTTMNFLLGSTFNIGLGTLPAGYAGYLTNDTTSSQVALVLTSAINPHPVMTSVQLTSSTTLLIGGNNGFANRPYNVLASTNVSLPLANWTSIATNIFAPDGTFSFTTPVDPARPTRFFLLQAQ